MKKTLLITVLILTQFYAFTQDTTKFSSLKLGFIISGSEHFNGLEDLNSFFKSYDIMALGDYLYSPGIGVYFRTSEGASYGSLIYTILYAENDGQNLNLKLKGGGLYTTLINYDLLRNKPATLLYPHVGFGFSYAELNLINKNYNETEFSQIIGNLAGEKSFESNNVFYIDLGFGYEKRIRVFYLDAHIGLNVSYGINFNKFKWNSLQGQVINSIPSIKTDGFKLNVVFRFEINEQRFKESRIFKRRIIRD